MPNPDRRGSALSSRELKYRLDIGVRPDLELVVELGEAVRA